MEDQSSNQSDCVTLIRHLDCSLEDEDISNWVNGDEDDQDYQLLSDEDINQEVASRQPDDTPDDHKEDEVEDPDIPNSGIGPACPE